MLRPTDVTLAVIMASPMAPETTMVGPPCDLLETCHGAEGVRKRSPDRCPGWYQDCPTSTELNWAKTDCFCGVADSRTTLLEFLMSVMGTGHAKDVLWSE